MPYCANCGKLLIVGESKCVYCGMSSTAGPSLSNVTGGVNINGDADIRGDVVGRDKITNVHGDHVEGDKVTNHVLNFFASAQPEEVASPRPPRLRRELQTLIGQRLQLDALQAAWQQVTSTRIRRAVFLTGPIGFGRKAVARAFCEAHHEDSIALTLQFFPVEGLQADEIAALWEVDPRWQPALTDYAALINQRYPHAVKIAGAPWLVLMAQLISQVPTLLKENRQDDPRALNHLLRVAAKQQAVILSVEDLDLASDPLWITLLKALLEESAIDHVPLLLIATVATRQPIAQVAKDDLHEALWFVKEMQKRGLAESRFFETVTTSEVAVFTGPAQTPIIERLWTLADGIPLLVETLWQEWTREEVVEQRQGRWIAARPFEEHWVWGDMKDLAESLLADCLDESSAFDFDAAQEMLHIAALEGETFTVEAVAKVLNVEVDDVIDFFDDDLLETDEVDGILDDLGFQCVGRNDTELELHRYAFSQPYLQHVWLKYVDKEQRQTWSLQLARTLENLWWPDPKRVARTLARLYTEGSDPARAAEYQRAADFASALDALEWHVAFLAPNVGDDRFELLRLFELQMKLGHECLGRVHWSRALHAYQAAAATAAKTGIRRDMGQALYGQGFAYQHGGVLDKDLDFFQQALAIWCEVGDLSGEGSTLNCIGTTYYERGQMQEALDTYEQALAILREVGDRSGEGTTLNNIGEVYRARGQMTEALDTFQQALAILREVGDRVNEGGELNNIGAIYHARGQPDEALDTFQQALAIRREVGDRSGEGTTLNNIGLIYKARGQLDEALDTYQQALAILREVGDRLGEGTTLNNIGLIYKARGQLDEALDYLEQAIVIFREVGDRWSESTLLGNIGVLLDELGRTTEAVEYLEQNVALDEAIGHPDLESDRAELERVRAKLGNG